MCTQNSCLLLACPASAMLELYSARCKISKKLQTFWTWLQWLADCAVQSVMRCGSSPYLVARTMLTMLIMCPGFELLARDTAISCSGDLQTSLCLTAPAGKNLIFIFYSTSTCRCEYTGQKETRSQIGFTMRKIRIIYFIMALNLCKGHYISKKTKYFMVQV